MDATLYYRTVGHVTEMSADSFVLLSVFPVFQSVNSSNLFSFPDEFPVCCSRFYFFYSASKLIADFLF